MSASPAPRGARSARAITLLALPLLAACLLIGPADTLSPRQSLAGLLKLLSMQPASAPEDTLSRTILFEVRLPRVLLTFLVGGALALAGNGLQVLFRNPLVCPYLLGLSAGGAFGAALALATGWLPLQPAAFCFGLLAVGMSVTMARSRGQVAPVALILSGVIVSGIFTALLTILQFLSDPFKLQTIVHWTMGSLHTATWEKLRSAAPPIVSSALWLFLLRWRLNVLAMGEEHARAAGLHPGREKLLVILPATLAASAAVAVAGVIGLAGLMVPHLVRMLVGPDNTRAVPLGFVFGGMFLLLVDTCSRSTASFELPVGVFTTLAGCPFFLFLLKRSRIGWEL
jgi:iron complex transport system permease protein